MKTLGKLLGTTFLFVLTSNLFAQTNSLPSSGNVGVGTTNPSTTLDVVGDSYFDGPVTIDSVVIVTDSVTLEDRLTVEQDFKLKGDAVFRQQMKVVGEAKFKADAIVEGLMKMKGDAKVLGDLKIKSLEDPNMTGQRLMAINPSGKLVPAFVTLPPDDTYTCNYTMPWAFADGTSTDDDIILCPNFKGVGIGSIPDAKLHVNGTTLLKGNVGVGLLTGNDLLSPLSAQLAVEILPAYDKIGFKVLNAQDRNLFFVPKLNLESYSKMALKEDLGLFWSDNNGDNQNSGLVIAPVNASSYSGIRINNNGQVGIGTPLINNSKGYLLAVNGKVGAKEFEVEITSNTWPDYVFSKDYNLMTIQELKSYIEMNNHLPEIPAAKEAEENGVSLGEMNKLLLKKVEELTLYIIELENRISQIEN